MARDVEADGLPRARSTVATRLAANTKKFVNKIKIPFRDGPNLIDKSRPYFSGVKHFGIKKLGNMINDPFHTLLNMPWGRFILLFFTTYILEFMIFAIFFYIAGDSCIVGLEGKFSHALWLSSRTASAIGYDTIAPDPNCIYPNVVVMLEVIFSSLVSFILLGMVFARFSAPFKRASTVRFSTTATSHRHPTGYWCLSMRVSNLRKHQILQPSLRMVITAVDSITPSNYLFEHLNVENSKQQETNLELGFPANLVHVIRPESFLYNLSLLEMDTRMMEVLVFVDGIDAMTSKHMSARMAYAMHTPMNLEMRGKHLGLDFSEYDMTLTAWPQLDQELQAEVIEKGPRNSGMWTLRHQTFKKLTDRFATLEPPDSNYQMLPPSESSSSLVRTRSKSTPKVSKNGTPASSSEARGCSHFTPSRSDTDPGLGLGSLGKTMQTVQGAAGPSGSLEMQSIPPASSVPNTMQASFAPYMPPGSGGATDEIQAPPAAPSSDTYGPPATATNGLSPHQTAHLSPHLQPPYHAEPGGSGQGGRR
eukprot:gene15266-21348_t